MNKRIQSLLVTAIVVSALGSSVAIADSMYNFGSTNAQTKQTTGSNIPVANLPLSPEAFKNAVNTLSQQNQQILTNQFKAQFPTKSGSYVAPSTSIPTPSNTGPNIPAPTDTTPPSVTPVISSGSSQRPVMPTAAAPTPAVTTTSSPATPVYTGFSGNNANTNKGPTNNSGSSGKTSGWDIKY